MAYILQTEIYETVDEQLNRTLSQTLNYFSCYSFVIKAGSLLGPLNPLLGCIIPEP